MMLGLGLVALGSVAGSPGLALVPSGPSQTAGSGVPTSCSRDGPAASERLPRPGQELAGGGQAGSWYPWDP